MRYLAFLFGFFVIAACFDDFAFADETWKLISGITESDIKEIAVDQYNKDVIYAASLRTLYRTDDRGDSWKAVFTARGGANNINFITTLGQTVFVCTEKGVFKSLDGRLGWRRIFKGVGDEENSALHMAILNNKIFLGTKGGLFTSDDKGLSWKKERGEAGNLSVKWIVFLGGNIFLATEKGVYKKSDSGWKRIFVTITEEAEYDSDTADEAVSAARPVNSVLADRGKVFLATDSGIFESGDGGESWNRFTSDGLLSEKVNRLLFADNLYAATDKGVFIFNEKDKDWESLYRGMDADEVESLVVDGEGVMWVATNKGVYKGIASSATDGGLLAMTEEREVLELFNHEPSIREVQEAAIKYAEVHPDKIKQWRAAASKKALLPDVSVGVDRYVTDYWHWDAGQNPDILQKGNDVISWDVTATWDLGELIWNDDQTSIDTRSRLMVQLRDDILDEVTRTYFERRRLQIETHLSPPSDAKQKLERDLRIQELTADLDALTGGQFSRQLNL